MNPENEEIQYMQTADYPDRKSLEIKLKRNLSVILLLLLTVIGCSSPFGGILNTGGTNDPRKLLAIAQQRMNSSRVIGARNVLSRAIEQSIRREDTLALATSYNLMGDTWIARDDQLRPLADVDAPSAESYYKKAEVLAQEHEYSCELLHSYMGFSLTYEIQGDTVKACDYQNESELLATTIRIKLKENPLVCTAGEQEFASADDRLLKLKSHLKCDNAEGEEQD